MAHRWLLLHTQNCAHDSYCVLRSELEQVLCLTAADIDDSLLSLGLGAGALDDGIVLKRKGVIERQDEVLVALGTLLGVGDASRQVLLK